MAHVARGAKKHRVFADIDREIADPLERAKHENQVQVVLATPRRLLDARGKGRRGLLVNPVELLVAGVQLGAEGVILL